LSCSQVSGCSPPDEFLKLGRLRFTILLLQLFC